jgi:hypothetical protein
MEKPMENLILEKLVYIQQATMGLVAVQVTEQLWVL